MAMGRRHDYFAAELHSLFRRACQRENITQEDAEWCGAEWSPVEEVSRELNIRIQSQCALKLLHKLQLLTTPRFSSLTRPTETEKVSFQPPIQEWQAWLNNAMEFCSQSNTFSDSRYIFCRASICVIHLWAFTDFCFTRHCSLMLASNPNSSATCALFYLSSIGDNRTKKDGSCIFNQLPSSCTTHPGSLTCQGCLVKKHNVSFCPFVWLQQQSSTDCPILTY